VPLLWNLWQNYRHLGRHNCSVANALYGSGELLYIFLSGMNMLQYDTIIAGIVKALGWTIMIAAIVWFVVKAMGNKT
jgi:hypothetical protein